MSETEPESTPSMADVAAESPAESAAAERQVLGEQPDTGDEVPADHAQ